MIPNKSILYFSILMAATLFIYSIARNQLWSVGSSCSSLSQINELQGESYLLNRQINTCKSGANRDLFEQFQHNSKRLKDCQRLEQSLKNEFLDLKRIKAGVSNQDCKSQQCFEELSQCERAFMSISDSI